MQKTDVNTAFAIFFVVFAVVFIVGLAVIPPATQQEAQAANQNSDSRNKGQQGEISSDCKRQGKDKKVVDECITCKSIIFFFASIFQKEEAKHIEEIHTKVGHKRL
jgi:flagellar biosynthesis/type III secretory pathway M-ring protein FliF/YscJ